LPLKIASINKELPELPENEENGDVLPLPGIEALSSDTDPESLAREYSRKGSSPMIEYLKIVHQRFPYLFIKFITAPLENEHLNDVELTIKTIFFLTLALTPAEAAAILPIALGPVDDIVGYVPIATACITEISNRNIQRKKNRGEKVELWWKVLPTAVGFIPFRKKKKSNKKS
jgi:hypothetical protein